VLAGDYQLSNIKNSNHLILGSEENSLTPGMSIRMAIVMDKLRSDHGKVCPMPHCGFTSSTNALGGGYTWSATATDNRKLVFTDAAIAPIAESGLLKHAESKTNRVYKKLSTQVMTSRLQKELET
jgi:hypothetical protein